MQTKSATKSAHMSTQRISVLAYLASNPGACTAEIDRACRTARKGHAYMYALVGRMAKDGQVTFGAARTPRGNSVGVYPV